MKGNTVNEFIDDILITGGPEKEFIFRKKFYFLETLYNQQQECMELRIEEYDRPDPSNTKLDKFVKTHIYTGKDFVECTAKFEKAKIFDGMTIYEAESEIEVIFG